MERDTAPAPGEPPRRDQGAGDLTYEQLVERLEELTDRLAGGDIGIEEAASLYEEAGRLHAEAAGRLARVEARIAELRADAGPEAAAADPSA